MGLKQRSAVGKFVKLKEGKFYLSTDKENANSFDELEGTLVDIYLKDESYEGKPQRKVYITMNDGEENLIVGFRIDSRYASSFLSFIKNIDVTKPFTLVPISKTTKGEDGQDQTVNSLLVSQNGAWAKAYFSKDHPNGLPEMRKVKISGKTMWDKTDQIEFFENMIEKEIKPQLQKVEVKTTVLTDEVPDEEVTDTLVEEDSNELPWEK